jgi:hypothetical protein
MTIILRPEQESVPWTRSISAWRTTPMKLSTRLWMRYASGYLRVHPERPTNPWRQPPGGWRPLENGMGFAGRADGQRAAAREQAVSRFVSGRVGRPDLVLSG